MQNPLHFIKQKISPSYLGVDIGTTSVKMVEVEGGKVLPRIANYGLLEAKNALARTNTALQTSSLKLFEGEIVKLLRLLREKMDPKTTEAVASIPGFSAFTTILDFPEMGQADLTNAVVFKAKQYIPLPLSEVALDWMKIGASTDAKGSRFEKVLIISVPQEQIRRYQRLFKEAGLSLRALEIEPLSLMRSVIAGDPTPTLVIDIGSRATAVAVAAKGELKFTGQSDFGGSSLTQALSSSMGVSPARAEELKRERGIAGTGPNYELSTIMVPFLDAILGDVKRIERSYEAQFPDGPKLERVILTGGGANLLGIEKYVGEQFGIPAVKASPFSRFEYPPTMEPLVGELGPLMSIALGLTLREFI